MEPTTVYEALKYWGPLLTICTLVWRAYHRVTDKVTVWADRLMHNHLAHIQAATEVSAKLLAAVYGHSQTAAIEVEKVAVDLKEYRTWVEGVTRDLDKALREHADHDDKVQAEILRDLAVLKDRV